MTHKEILKIIKQKNPKFNKKEATKWLKAHPIFVQELDPEIVANQYLNKVKDRERIATLDTRTGILLGTVDRKFSKGGIKKVFADILSKEGVLERVQWWGSVPRENKTMQTLPILHICDFKGAMTDLWVAPDGSEWINFDVDAIISSKISFGPETLSFDEFSMINLDTQADEIPEGRNMAVVFGRITSILPYQEKTWSKELDAYEFSSDHPFLLGNNLVLSMGIRVNEDIYVRAHFPEQQLGYPTWIINNDLTKIEGIKQVLAKMPVNSTNDREALKQLQAQSITVSSILTNFLAMVVGEIRVNREESVDETRTFIHMAPTFISIRSITPEDKVHIQGTLETEEEEVPPYPTIKEMADEAEEEKIIIPPVPTGLTEEKLTYEAVNQFGTQGESMAKSKVKELKAQYERFNIPIDIANLIKTAAKELGVDITGYEKEQAKHQTKVTKEKLDALELKAAQESQNAQKKTKKLDPQKLDKPTEKVIKEIQKHCETTTDYIEIRKLIADKREELGFFVNDTAAAHIIAKDLNVDTKSLQTTGSAIRGTGEDTLDIPQKKAKKTTPAPTKRKRKESPYVDHFKCINEVLNSFEGAEDEVNVTLLPMPVWDILLLSGYCYEPQPGKILALGSDYQLDAKTKKALTQFFKKNPTLRLRPEPIEDIEKAIREKLTELKKVVPDAIPEHLKPMLESFNLDAPIELIAKIWETL